jgi:hypothetical protein
MAYTMRQGFGTPPFDEAPFIGLASGRLSKDPCTGLFPRGASYPQRTELSIFKEPLDRDARLATPRLPEARRQGATPIGPPARGGVQLSRTAPVSSHSKDHPRTALPACP